MDDLRLANKNGTAATTYTYQTGLSGHIADLISKLTAQQRLWTFGDDAAGNLTTVADPDDPNGYPKTIIDVLNHATTFGYDVRGNVIQVTDPLTPRRHAGLRRVRPFPASMWCRRTRRRESTSPRRRRSTTARHVTKATAPNNAVTTYSYDNNDEVTVQPPAHHFGQALDQPADSLTTAPSPVPRPPVRGPPPPVPRRQLIEVRRGPSAAPETRRGPHRLASCRSTKPSPAPSRSINLIRRDGGR